MDFPEKNARWPTLTGTDNILGYGLSPLAEAGRSSWPLKFLRSAPAPYVLAVSSVLLSGLARLEMAPLLGNHCIYVTFSIAVLISAAIGGWKPGLLAMVLGAVAADCLFLGSLRADVLAGETSHLSGLIIYLSLSAVSIGVGETQRQLQRRSKTLVAHLLREVDLHLQTGTRLAASQERYRSLFDHNLDAVFTMNLTGRFLTANPSSLKLSGYSLSELCEWNFQDLCRDDELSQMVCRLQDAAESFAAKFTAKDGRLVDLLITGGPIMVNQETVGIFAIARDITEQKRAASLLGAFSKLGQKLSSVMTSVEAGRIIGDIAGELFGWDAFSLNLYSLADNQVDYILNIDTFQGEKTEILPFHSRPGIPPLAHRIMEQGAKLILHDEPSARSSGFTPFGDTSSPSASLMLAPIRYHDKTIGILSIQSHRPGAYQPSDLAALQTLADYCGGALQRIRAETALRESENRFASFMRHLPAAAWMKDAQGRYVYANAACAHVLHQTPEEIWRRTDEELFPPALAQKLIAADRSVLASGGCSQTMESFGQPDGFHYALVNKFPVLNQHGMPAIVAGIALDITPLKAAEKALAFSNDRLGLIARVTNAVVGDAPLADQMRNVAQAVRAAYNVEACVIRALNPAGGLELLASAGIGERALTPCIPARNGIGSEIIARRTPLFIPDLRAHAAHRLSTYGLRQHPDLVSYVGAPMMVQDRVIGVVGIYTTGEVRHFTPVDLEHLQVIANHIAVSIVNDSLYREVSRQRSDLEEQIAERQQAENQIQWLNADLERRVQERTQQLQVSNRELEAFSYSISHDLRGPLRSISGFAEMLQQDYQGQMGQMGQESLNRIIQASHDMSQLIDDLLHLSRLTRADLKCQPVDLSALAEGIVTGLRETQPARRVEFAIAPGLTAAGDARLMRIALDNLLSNAWKFTGHQAAARIEFGMQSQADGPAYYVRDNGAGFDMAYADKLFNAFQRLHHTTEFPGHGIGLATVQRIIHRHGGRTWATGEVDCGAAFYFTLPN